MALNPKVTLRVFQQPDDGEITGSGTPASVKTSLTEMAALNIAEVANSALLQHLKNEGARIMSNNGLSPKEAIATYDNGKEWRSDKIGAVIPCSIANVDYYLGLYKD